MKTKLLRILLTLLPLVTWGQGTVEGDDGTAEPYVVLTGDTISGTTLTFYYDNQQAAHQSAMPLPNNGYSVTWENYKVGITKVVFDPSFANYTSLESTGFWFSQCDKLVTIEGIENLKTDNVTNMGFMFRGCSSLTSLDVSGFKTDKVTSMGLMFSGCSGLTNLDVSGFNTANVTTMESMFGGCSGLTTLDVSSFNTANVEHMTLMFYGCSNLTTIYAGDGWNFEKVGDNGAIMFYNCPKLVGGKGTTYDANRVDYTYARIDGGPNSETPGYFTRSGDAPYVAPEPYAVLSENNTVLTFYYDKEKQIRGGLDVIEWWVGYEDLSWHPYRETITNIVFDSTFINCTTLGCAAYWFRNCVNLTTISGLQYFNTENIQYMGSMFEGCYSLTDIDVSGFNTAKVTDMWNMFKNCSALTNLDLSSFNTSAAIAMNNMFDGCANLKTIYVGSEWSVSSITSGDGGANMFLGCTNLVGGAGTAYDANHTDYTYAHIDGGSSNPGYFTDKNAPVYVDLPTFRFEGDNLVMETVTEGASIFYAMADLTSTDDAVVDSAMNSLAVVPGDKNSFYYQEPVELVRNVVIKAIAVTNTAVSDTATLAYDYSAWQSFLQALSYCSDVYRRAYGNSKVDSITVDELGRAIEECHHIYEERAYVPGIEATELAMGIMELAREIEGMLNQTDTPEPYAVLSENNTVLTFYYDGNKTAYRDAMGVGPFVTLQSVAWKDYRESISSVVFNNSFASYTALSSTANWFAYCSNLTTITGLEFLKTDNVTDMNHMFYRCSGLTGIELSGFNTEQVSNMNSLFEGCSGLTSLDVSAFNTSNVTNMSWLFEGCSGLTSLDVSGFNTSSVTDMRHMFAICSALKAIYVGDDWSTVSVSEGSDMFNDCYNLVGGAGTTYNQEYTDYTYAHIDGGSSNPGYFTDKNAPEYVAAPTFRFEGDNLVMETETEGASIFYQMEELPNMDEATIEKISSGMTVTADAQQSTFYEQPVEITKSVIIKAIAAGAALSEVSTLVYDYDAWQDLLKAMEYGADVYGRAQDNSAVDPAMLEDLGWMLDEGKMFYDERATMDSYEAQHIAERIMELARQIEEMMNTVVADATFDSNGVLTVGGATTMADALEAAGGRAEVAKTITAVVWNSTATLTNADLQGLDNPNMLIYVNSEDQAPQNRNNVVVVDFAKTIVLTDVSEGNGNFYCPREFKAEMISYSHEYRQQTEVGVARGWESIALPFTVQTIMHETNGVIAPFNSDASNRHFWLRQMTEEGLTGATQIEANTPYLISMPNSDAYSAEFNQAGRVTFSSQNALVPMTEVRAFEMHQADGSMLVFMPSFQRQSADAMMYALNVGEQRDGYPEGSVFEANYRDIRPFEAFTIHEGGQRPAPQYLPIADMNGGVTGIENLTPSLSEGEGAWYDLSGRKLQRRPNRKGVYILNGRKTVVK